MRLQRPESADDAFHLVMSPEEWKEICALAQFARAGIDYDCAASYGMQVFDYKDGVFPAQIKSDPEMEGAFCHVERLQQQPESGDRIHLKLSKNEMRKLLFALRKATCAQEQADTLTEIRADGFNVPFPEMVFAARHYTDSFTALLTALNEDRSLDIPRPEVA